MNEGFRSSEGWNEKFNILIHLLAPLVSGKNKIATIESTIPSANKKKEKKIKFFKDNRDKVTIMKTPTIQKIMCFLKSKLEAK